MRVSKENDSGDRRPWPTKRHTLGSYSARASANPRSHVGSGSAEPPSAAFWPTRNPDSGRLTQPHRKDTKGRGRLQPPRPAALFPVRPDLIHPGIASRVVAKRVAPALSNSNVK